MILSNNDHDTDYHDSTHHQEPLFKHHHYHHQQNHERKYMWRFYQSGIGEFRLCQKDKGQICKDENIMKLLNIMKIL